ADPDRQPRPTFDMNQPAPAPVPARRQQPRSDRTTVIADRHVLDARKYPRYLVRIEHLEAELDVGKHDVGRTARDDVHGIAILLPALDLASGKFAPEAIGFHNEAAAVLIRQCGKLNLLRASPPDEHVRAFVRAAGPRSGEIDGACLFRSVQTSNYCRDDCKL